jgi:hypothetical protein
MLCYVTMPPPNVFVLMLLNPDPEDLAYSGFPTNATILLASVRYE